MDIFYIQGCPFFHTISRKVQFRTVAPVLNRRKATILCDTKAVPGLYQSRGFDIADLHTDMEFEYDPAKSESNQAKHGIDFEEAKEIWADPEVTRNTHTIRLEADSVRLTMKIENVPSEENLKTGKLTPLSVIATLRGLVSPIKAGT